IRAMVDCFYDAWNRHDAATIVEPFGASGVYADPFTPSELHGDTLADHVQSVFDVIGDLRVAVTRAIVDSDAAAVAWTIEGTWDGRLGPLTASGVAVRFAGTDVFELDHGRLRRVRRSFDERALAEALGLQTIVEPYRDGTTTFGYSLRTWVSAAKPGVLGMT